MKAIFDWLRDYGMLTLVSAAIGGVVTLLLGALRRSIQTVSYSVVHNQIGFSADDRIHGEVRVTYKGSPLRNLFMTVVTVTNTTTRDLDTFTFTVCAGTDTILRTEESGIEGLPYAVLHSDEYRASIAFPDGERPTADQVERFSKRREYTLKGFNRKQTAVVRILSNVPDFDCVPTVWVAARQTGLKVAPLPTGKVFMGVPSKISATIGLVISAVTLALVIWLAHTPWSAAVVCMVVGLFAQVIAAWLYKTARAIRNLLMG